jgi:hypothetical protein
LSGGCTAILRKATLIVAMRNFFLVLLGILVKVTHTMKRFLALTVLLGFVGILAGCDNSGGTKTDTGAATNAAPAMPSTNK